VRNNGQTLAKRGADLLGDLFGIAAAGVGAELQVDAGPVFITIDRGRCFVGEDQTGDLVVFGSGRRGLCAPGSPGRMASTSILG